MEELFKRYVLTKLDNETVHISSRDNFDFCYTIADAVVRKEYIVQYRYFGGLQCNYQEGTDEYKELEKRLCETAEFVLGIKWEKDGKLEQ